MGAIPFKEDILLAHTPPRIRHKKIDVSIERNTPHLGSAWIFRFYTNTASGRFYKNYRWTWKTLVVEKEGFVHWRLPPKDGQESADNLEQRCCWRQ